VHFEGTTDGFVGDRVKYHNLFNNIYLFCQYLYFVHRICTHALRSLTPGAHHEEHEVHGGVGRRHCPQCQAIFFVNFVFVVSYTIRGEFFGVIIQPRFVSGFALDLGA